MNVYLVIGEANTRKSSLIRSLTGVRNTGTGHETVYDVATTTEVVIKVLCYTSALQERNNPALTNPSAFVIEVSNAMKIKAFSDKAFSDVLVPLRVSETNWCKFNYADFINEFINAGWNISGVALLGQTASRISSHHIQNPVIIQNSSTNPSNANSSLVRAGWNWR